MPGYRIWFTVPNYCNVQLPVNPQEVTVTYPGDTASYDVEGIGEIIIPKRPKLATFNFSSFFPREHVFTTLPNNIDGWYTPEWYVNFFRTLQKNRVIFQVTIVRGSDYLTYTDEVFEEEQTITTEYFDTVIDNAILIDFSITDKGGEPGDVYFDMTFSEYRDASPSTLSEIESQTVVDGQIVEQKLVLSKNRPQQNGAIVSGRTVTLFGKVYTEEELEELWQKTKEIIFATEAVVTRVLPPPFSQGLHSAFFSGIGWVNSTSCSLSEEVELAGTLKGINNG